MTDERRLALILYELAKVLPKHERHAFGTFLFSQPGAEPPARKVHSWRKKKKRLPPIVRPPRAASSKPAPSRQLELPLEQD